MKNQFFYTIEATPNGIVKEGEEQEIVNLVGSFNMDKVIRTLEYDKDKLMILLDDFHPEFRDVRIPLYGKNNKSNGGFKIEHREITVCSEIMLNEEDSKRYRELTEVKQYSESPLSPK